MSELWVAKNDFCLIFIRALAMEKLVYLWAEYCYCKILKNEKRIWKRKTGVFILLFVLLHHLHKINCSIGTFSSIDISVNLTWEIADCPFSYLLRVTRETPILSARWSCYNPLKDRHLLILSPTFLFSKFIKINFKFI